MCAHRSFFLKVKNFLFPSFSSRGRRYSTLCLNFMIGYSIHDIINFFIMVQFFITTTLPGMRAKGTPIQLTSRILRLLWAGLRFDVLSHIELLYLRKKYVESKKSYFCVCLSERRNAPFRDSSKLTLKCWSRSGRLGGGGKASGGASSAVISVGSVLARAELIEGAMRRGLTAQRPRSPRQDQQGDDGDDREEGG